MKKLFNMIARGNSPNTRAPMGHLIGLLTIIFSVVPGVRYAQGDTLALNRDGWYQYKGPFNNEILLQIDKVNWPVGKTAKGWMTAKVTNDNRFNSIAWSNPRCSGSEGVSAKVLGMKVEGVEARLDYQFTVIDPAGVGKVTCGFDYDISGPYIHLPPVFRGTVSSLQDGSGNAIADRVFRIIVFGVAVPGSYHEYTNGGSGPVESAPFQRRAGPDASKDGSRITLEYDNSMEIAPEKSYRLLSVAGSGKVKLNISVQGEYLRFTGPNGPIAPNQPVTLRDRDSLSISAVNVPFGVYKDTVTVEAELE
ncbi:hypothetical protein I5481_21010 [Citrobacter freundii]|nr:hypothetical protein [Citrobacter freundii]